MSAAENKAVFLSYASQDAAAAKRICEALRAAGVEVWFDQSELRGGDAWDQKIRKQVKECALFVPVISANTQARHEGYFRLEWRLADQRTHLMGKSRAFIVPVCIDDTRDDHADVPDSFVAVQWTRLTDGATTKAFCAHVKALLEPGAARSSPIASSGREVSEVPAAAPDESIRQRGRTRRLIAIAGLTAAAGLGLWFWRGRVVVVEPQTSAARPSLTTNAARRSRPDVAALLARVRVLTDKTDVVRAGLDTASGLLDQAAKLDSTDANVWAEWALVDRRYYDEWYDRSPARVDALQRHASQALSLDPANRTAQFARAASMFLLNKDARPEAIALLESVATDPEADPGALVLLANLKYQRAQPEAAFGYLDRAARSPNWTGRVAIGRAWAYALAGDWEHGIEMLDRGLVAERSTSILMLKSFFVVIWRGDVATARELNALIPPAILSEDLPASARYWGCLWARDYEGAYQALKIVPRDYIEANALSGPTGYYRGYALARAGKMSAAKVEWQSALEVVHRRLNALPNDRMPLEFKSALLHSLGDSAAASEIWRSVDELFGDRFSSWADYFTAMEVLPEDSALDRLTVEVRTGSTMGLAANLRLSPVLDRLRRHPRFIALLAQAEADPRLSPKANQRETPSAGKSDAGAAPDPKSVVVLPFANLSGDPAQEYFSDGLTEEILSALSSERDLRVPGRTSAFSFKGKSQTAPEIARALNVAQVVEGSVRKAGNQVRITVTLTRAVDGFSEPLGTFTEKLEDIFALQEKIARAVVEKITRRTTTATTVAVQTRNPAAYDAYLRGRAAQMAIGGRDEAVRFFQEAIQLDPNYALPWARLSQVYERLIYGGFDRSDENFARAREAAGQALRLAPDLPEAHFALAMTKLGREGDADAARRELGEAVRLRPNDPEAPWIKARIDYALGRWDKDLGDLIVRAANLDRQNASALISMTQSLTSIGRFADADEWGARATTLNSTDTLAARGRAHNHAIWTGDLAGALQFLASVTESMPGAELGLMTRGDLRAEVGDLAGAIADYAAANRVAATLGDYSGPRGWIVRINCKIARLEIRRGNRARAHEILRTTQLDAQKLVRDFPQATEGPLFLALVCALRGEEAASRAALAEAKKVTQQAHFGVKRNVWLAEAEILALFGDTQAAVANLRSLHEMGHAFGYGLRTGLEWEPLRGEAGFQRLLKEAEARADAVPRPNK